MSETIVRIVIEEEPVSIAIAATEVGGGSATYAGLTDKATTDLPVINGPLGTALAGKETAGAAAAAQAFARQRANHTGTQSHTTITGLGTLATQSGDFSGTHSGDSSGTNTGDQDLSNFLSRRTMLEVNGTDAPISQSLVEQGYLSNGRRVWANGDGGTLLYDGARWFLTQLDPDSLVVYDAFKTSGSYEPWLLTGWTVTNGSGEPTFVLDPAEPLGNGVIIALDVPADTNGGFLTAGTGGTLPITRGGTGETTAPLARTALGSGATGDQLFTAATPGAARTILEINRTRVTQAADVSNATTTFVDTDLVLTLEGEVDYLIRGQFDMVSTAAGTGFKIQLLTSQNINALVASGTSVGWVSQSSVVAVSLLTLSRSDFFTFTGLGTRRVQAEFRLNLVATGEVRIRFAQNAGSTAPASVFKAGSFWTSERL